MLIINNNDTIQRTQEENPISIIRIRFFNGIVHFYQYMLMWPSSAKEHTNTYTQTHAQMLINKFYSIFSMDYFIRHNPSCSTNNHSSIGSMCSLKNIVSKIYMNQFAYRWKPLHECTFSSTLTDKWSHSYSIRKISLCINEYRWDGKLLLHTYNTRKTVNIWKTH